MSNDQEIWKDIPGYEGLYKVSTLGRVYSCGRRIGKRSFRSMFLREQHHVDGYRTVMLFDSNRKPKRFNIHRLVAIAFLANPENKSEVNHKNGVKNDNRIENVEWCTRHENQRHRFNVLGQKRTFSEDHRRKLSEANIRRFARLKSEI